MASITRSSLSDQVKDFLLQAILSGSYPPGSRIVETRVARELGVSQATVREALRDLEVLGIVESTIFQGARVRQPEQAELAEAYGVRAELESYGFQLALPHLSGDNLEELQGYIDEMQRAASAGDVMAEAHVDAAFHGRVVEIAANSTLSRVWRFLEPQSRTYITFLAHHIDPLDMANLHQPILDALLKGDVDQTTAAVRRHFRIASEMFAEAMVGRQAAERAATDVTPGGSGAQNSNLNFAHGRRQGASGRQDRPKEHE
jgi:DNA-binding GntR family transcriptional regulator